MALILGGRKLKRSGFVPLYRTCLRFFNIISSFEFTNIIFQAQADDRAKILRAQLDRKRKDAYDKEHQRLREQKPVSSND